MNKRGSAFVEAAMIFPVVILAVVFVLAVMVNLYMGVSVQSRGHIMLREAAGCESGMIESSLPIRYTIGSEMRQTERIFPLECGVYAKKSFDTEQGYEAGSDAGGTGKIRRALSVRHRASAFLVNEAEGIRSLDFLKEELL